MNDDTFWSSGAPPVKRKRFSLAGTAVQEPSKVEDLRVPVKKGIRINCQTIEITVGPEDVKESFFVHEDAICDRSEFFRNAMKPEWSSLRPNPRIIDLPDDDAAAFSLYQQWLYSKQLPILPDDQDEPLTEGYHSLAYAYVLGERLMDREFKNAIADAYVLYARGAAPGKRYYPSNEDIRIIYDGTTEHAPIRQLLVDIWSCRGKSEWIDGDADLPKDFLAEVTKALLRARPSLENVSRPWKNRHEQYQEKDPDLYARKYGTGTSEAV